MKKPRIPSSRENFITVFLGILIIFSGVTYMTLYPKVQDPFFEFYVLNEYKLATAYYPSQGNWDAPRDFQFKWYLGLINSMDSAQLVLVKVKIGNATTPKPDEKTATAADIPVLLQFRRVLMPNENHEFPLAWRIQDVQRKGDMAYITLDMNGTVIKDIPVGAKKGENFRYVIELWTYDPQTHEFRFGWKAGDGRRVAWLQMWFSTQPP